jgi:hypothetical protein
LLAKLHLDSLSTKNTVKAVWEALQQLPKDLKDTYDEAMEHIEHQGDDDKQLAYHVLSWVANVKRPLSVEELREALVIEPHSTALDEDNLLDITIVLSVCAGLISVDETALVVCLIHYTTQDYLDRFQKAQFSKANTYILFQGLTYLSFPEFLDLPVLTRFPLFSHIPTNTAKQHQLVLEHPLLQYSPYFLLHIQGQSEIDLQD